MFNVSGDELLGIEPRDSSAAPVVHGNNNAVANGPHAKATVVVADAAGTAPICRKCPHLKRSMEFEKMMAKLKILH